MPDNSVFIPTISVCGNEVPLPAYWKIIELYDFGYSTESIVAEVLRYAGSSEASRIEDIVFHVIDNQVRMLNASSNVKRWNLIPKRKPGRMTKHRGELSGSIAEHRESQSFSQSQHDEQKDMKNAFVLLRNDQTPQSSAYLVTGAFESRLINGTELEQTLGNHEAAQNQVGNARRTILYRNAPAVRS